jgi:hypothetical protein
MITGMESTCRYTDRNQVETCAVQDEVACTSQYSILPQPQPLTLGRAVELNQKLTVRGHGRHGLGLGLWRNAEGGS